MTLSSSWSKGVWPNRNLLNRMEYGVRNSTHPHDIWRRKHHICFSFCCTPTHMHTGTLLHFNWLHRYCRRRWRTREDSNLWPLPSEGSALSSWATGACRLYIHLFIEWQLAFSGQVRPRDCRNLFPNHFITRDEILRLGYVLRSLILNQIFRRLFYSLTSCQDK